MEAMDIHLYKKRLYTVGKDKGTYELLYPKAEHWLRILRNCAEERGVSIPDGERRELTFLIEVEL